MDTKAFLVFGGKTGWIGQTLIEMIRAQGGTAWAAESRLENRETVDAEIKAKKTEAAQLNKELLILNSAGVTGRPNVDWCEDHKIETIRANVIGTLTLADVCFTNDVHLTNYATGCIFQYDDAHPMGGATFTENDEANFRGSFYSYTKGMVEALIRNYPNVLTLRVRMPISDDLNPRSFVTKISKYEKVVNIPNSMTVLSELLPASVALAVAKETGVLNFTNPGAISHNEVLALYKRYIDPDFKWNNFTVEEQAKILKAGRSNNELDADLFMNTLKKINYAGEVNEIHVAMEKCFQRMAHNMGKN
eukprot:TRINITY_DN16285_c0_g1::TRINITY_DN16285_c0_g1_i1::g.3153::m.3153 TRINITY_DN16285_c0_g1::TRINITY_DN16285_c0_g1_i1::g.3153  ORF type:complete len:328 (-),score=106.25,sp/Q9LQ04/RMLCD_ARATH/59.85/2e-109,Epimerase/PF01370.16/1.6e-10,RmlD_sub_bind/PF04321.12/1.2e-09,Polysacc_synt_2/PF02719.10/3.8e+02,Polysacc_synt_2/PF02719.10/0.11,NAD_binding_4/PF07993.7/5.4e+02,NAD_binding_4/PF07993.7/0.16 TRINITY_DN16285_c0_g1_i1:54-968(-)